MQVSKITEDVFQVTLPIVNVFLVDLPAGLLLIDTGPKNSEDEIFAAIEQIGKRPTDLRYIIITHAHHDHSGSLAAILKAVNVQVFASPLCAEMLKRGVAFEPESKLFSFLLKLITVFGLIRLQFIYINPVNFPIKIVLEGDVIPDTNGLQVINAPGHTLEQIALFYPIKEALLFAADAAENLKSLKPAFAYQSAKINQQTLKKLTTYDFKYAVFGHGSALIKENFIEILA
ncbi:MAG: MBL fold metallo-hydrolase [Janthinobacterium lividum]